MVRTAWRSTLLAESTQVARQYRGKRGLDHTLLTQNENFWYFNNGITALCESIKKTPRGALDQQQERIRRDMLLSLHKQYSVKRGENVPAESDGCTVELAIVALACAHNNPYYTVLAKSAVGRLSENTERAPYTNLFNNGTSAHRVWRCVQVMRAVEADLTDRQRNLVDREFAVAAHGNRLVLQLVFNQLRLDKVDDANYDWDKETKRVHKVTGIALEHLTEAIESTYSNNYLAPLFKNTTKCSNLVTQVETKFGSG